MLSSPSQCESNTLHKIRDNLNGGPIQFASFSRLLTIENISQTPLIVEYFQTANVTAEIVNNSIAAVDLTFRTNGGHWNRVAMTNLTAVTYVGSIPPQPWDTFVQYFVNATHLDGNVTVDDNQGQYYNYTVVDTVPPVIDITSPTMGELFRGIVTIDVDFSDPGSDIARHLDYIDGTLTGNGTSNGYVSGMLLPDGVHGLILYVFDNAGNRAQASVSFIVANPIAIPVIFYSLGALGTIVITCIVCGILLSKRER